MENLGSERVVTQSVRFPENIWLGECVSFENSGSGHDVGCEGSIFWRRI